MRKLLKTGIGKPKIVVVEWEDASSGVSGWCSIKDVESWRKPNVLIRNTGYVVVHNKNHMVLASRWDIDKEGPCFGLLQKIPNSLIRRVKRLTDLR